MTEIPPLDQLAANPEEWRRLHAEIRARQKARRGRWDAVIHPLEIAYARICWRGVRALSFIRILGWAGCLTLFLVYVVVGGIVGSQIKHHAIVAAVVANVVGIVAAVAYYFGWRAWQRDRMREAAGLAPLPTPGLRRGLPPQPDDE